MIILLRKWLNDELVKFCTKMQQISLVEKTNSKLYFGFHLNEGRMEREESMKVRRTQGYNQKNKNYEEGI